MQVILANLDSVLNIFLELCTRSIAAQQIDRFIGRLRVRRERSLRHALGSSELAGTVSPFAKFDDACTPEYPGEKRPIEERPGAQPVQLTTDVFPSPRLR